MNQNQALPSVPGYGDWLEVVRTYAACERALAARFAEGGLSLAQHDVLVALDAAGPLRSVDLARRLVVTKSNVTALLRRMERDGLVASSPDPDDGRAKRIEATDEGRRRVAQTLAAQREVAAGMIGQLSPEESAALGDMMRRVRRHLEGAG